MSEFHNDQNLLLNLHIVENIQSNPYVDVKGKNLISLVLIKTVFIYLPNAPIIINRMIITLY